MHLCKYYALDYIYMHHYNDLSYFYCQGKRNEMYLKVSCNSFEHMDNSL